MDLSQSKQALENHIDELGKPYVSFFTGLWDLEESIEPVDWAPAEDDLEAMNLAMREGKTAFGVDAPKVSEEYVLEHVGSAIAYISMYAESFVDVNKKFSELKEEFGADGRSLPAEILDAALSEPELLIGELADLLEIEPESENFQYLRLAVATALEPTAYAAAAKIEIPEEMDRETGTCPVCGSQATIGVLRDEGEMSGAPRILHCTFCGSDWKFPRIKCTWCGTTDQEQLAFIFEEGSNMSHRVYTCKNCGGTQKIIQQKAAGSVGDLRANELLMLPLEEAAAKDLDK